MARSVLAFLAGVNAVAAIFAAVIAWHFYNTRPARVDTEICALDKAIVRVLVRSGNDIPKARKYDRYRRENAADVADIQAQTAC